MSQLSLLSQESFLSEGTMDQIIQVLSPEELDCMKTELKPEFQPDCVMEEPVGGQQIIEVLSHEELHHYMKTQQEPEFQPDYGMEEPIVFQDVLSLGALPDSTGTVGTSGVTTLGPLSTSILPSHEDYPGPYQFTVDLISLGSDTTKCEYSETLNKIYVTMGTNIPFHFKTKHNDGNLFVRALPIFLGLDSQCEPVRRCPTHLSEEEKSNEGFVYIHHVVRCDDKRTVYDKNEESKRLSLLVPLDCPQAGAQGTTITFTFMCKNSCSLGMNRRSTAIIFTLERENGTVCGRRMINLRICSCPKRDRRNEEARYYRKKTEPNENEEAPCSKEKFLVGKKAMKRLKTEGSDEMVDILLKVPKTLKVPILRLVREAVAMPQNYRELNEAEKITIEQCKKQE